MKLTNRVVLFIILIVASVLRLVNYFDIPYTHDEFSAIFRLDFNSFSELIEKGVKIDGHPAGIQVFLYFWTQLFGFEEWVVKGPFIVFGILSVLLIYFIANKWFNETVGLLSSAFLASIQFTVMYSQIARPYISGLFFSLLMVYYWTNLIKNPNNKFYKNSILFVVSASLCTYNHHFSLLFAAIVGISGLCFIEKEFLAKYIISGISILIIYIPHLEIFIYQLNVGGVEEWLGKPPNDFIIKYIQYIFHFSLLPLIIALGIFMFGARDKSLKKINHKHYILFFSWFILPLLIGFFYSKHVSSVLQYSVLIFSFSYLFFLLFGHFKLQKPIVNLILVSIILCANVFTLIFERKHYNLFYHSPYEEIVHDYLDLRKTNNNAVFIIDSHKKITNHYLSNLDIETGFIWYDSFKSESDFKVFLEHQSKIHDKLFLGCLSSNNPLTLAIIKEHYPKIELQNNYAGGTTYLFSKELKKRNSYVEFLDFESEEFDSWSSIDLSKFSDSISSSGERSYLIDSMNEWSPTYSKELNNIISNENNFIDISVDAYTNENLEGVILVSSIESNGEVIHWGGTDFNRLIPLDGLKSTWTTFYHSIKLSDVNQNYDNTVLKTFIWNKGRKNFIIDDFKIELRKGNPVIYGLVEKIH